MANIDKIVADGLSKDNLKDFLKQLEAKKKTIIKNQIQKTALSPQYILDNGIENYIEKGCIEPCKRLWNLNIYTFESSNNASYKTAWIDILDLSEENMLIFQELVEQGKAGKNPYTHCECLIAPLGENAESTFLEAISKFKIQDISPKFYKTEEAFLDNAKRENGKCNILDDGTIERLPNPKLKNLTFEEALHNSGKEFLYEPDSHRVFEDEMSLNGYLRYKESTKEIKR